MTDEDNQHDGLMMDEYEVDFIFTMRLRATDKRSATSRAMSYARKLDNESALELLDFDEFEVGEAKE